MKQGSVLRFVTLRGPEVLGIDRLPRATFDPHPHPHPSAPDDAALVDVIDPGEPAVVAANAAIVEDACHVIARLRDIDAALDRRLHEKIALLKLFEAGIPGSESDRCAEAAISNATKPEPKAIVDPWRFVVNDLDAADRRFLEKRGISVYRQPIPKITEMIAVHISRQFDRLHAASRKTVLVNASGIFARRIRRKVFQPLGQRDVMEATPRMN